MIAYDISDDRIRGKVRKILTNHGTRVQYSIFECYLAGLEKKGLQTELAGLIEQDDSIRWYPLCVWCREKIILQGQGTRTENPGFYLL